MAPAAETVDPLRFAQMLWPHVVFTREQQQIIYSVIDNDDTYVPAANEMGKDFVSGFVCLYFFITRYPCRIITTSVKDDHLRVLWGEIGRFVQSSARPLDHKQGGPLILNHRDIKRVYGGQVCQISYLRGMVSEKGEGLAGHHVANTGDGVPRTLAVCDEASGIDDEVEERVSKWAVRKLVIGNCYPCENFFKYAVKGNPKTNVPGGDIPRDPDNLTKGYHRKVIRIRAEDSPNVRWAREQIRRGITPTDEVLVPGVKSWGKYQANRKLWDKVSQCIGLDAEFYEGASVLMFPPEWLNRAELLADELRSRTNRKAKAVGIDPAEGGDKTAMAAVDEYGVIDLESKRTPDTAIITGEALAFARKHAVPWDKVIFDRGGGGKEHADRLRQQGYPVQTIAFGESITMPLKRAVHPLPERREHVEERYAYKNRRAEMYGTLRQLLDPSIEFEYQGRKYKGFGIPREYHELRRQLAPIPLNYDQEGRMILPPKNRTSADSNVKTLTDLIGCSPDEADAVVLAVAGMLDKTRRPVAGGAA